MDDYAGRVLADRYRLPLPPSDAYELVETRAFDTYSGQEVLVRQVPLPEVVDAEVLDADGPVPSVRQVTGRAVRRPADPAVRRAVEAAQAAAQVPDHPRLDQVFDVFAEAGSLWIVSEFVAARPLAALLAERPLNPFRAAEIGSDVLAALRVLHAHGWTHRNITVRTVLVCDDGRVVLTGLAAGAAEEALCGYVSTPRPDGDEDDDLGYGRPSGGPDPAGVFAPPPPPAPPRPAELPASPDPVSVEKGRPPAGADPADDGYEDGYGDGAYAEDGPGGREGRDPYDEGVYRAARDPYGEEFFGERGSGDGEDDDRYGDDAHPAHDAPEGHGAYGDRDAPYARGAYDGHGARGGYDDRFGPRAGDGRGDGPGRDARSASAAGLEAVRRPMTPALPAYAPGGDEAPLPRTGAVVAHHEGARAARAGEERHGAGEPRSYGDGDDTAPLPVQRPAGPGEAGPPAPAGRPSPAGPWDADDGPEGDEPYAARPYDDAYDEGRVRDDRPFPGRDRDAEGRAAREPYARGPYNRDAYANALYAEDPDPEASYGDAPYGDEPDGRGDADRDGQSPPNRRLHLTGVWSDGPEDGGPVPAGGSGGIAARADTRLPDGPPPLPARVDEPADPPGPDHRPVPVEPPGRWDDLVASGRAETPYRGPDTPLAAERARQTRIAVVGAVTERWAPEQGGPIHENWRLAPPIGPATDLWALGALLYRAVQGHAPYPEENAAELVQMVCGEPPAFAEECGPLRPVVESLLRQDPTDRPDVEELSGWLRSLVRSAPEPEAGADVVTLPSDDAARLPVVRRRGELVRRRRFGRGAAHGRHRHTRERPERVDRVEHAGRPEYAERPEHAEPPRPRKPPKPPREPKGPKALRTPPPASPYGETRSPRRLGRLLLVLILLALVAAVGYAVFVLPKAGDGPAAGASGPDTSASGDPRPGAGTPGDQPSARPPGAQQPQTTRSAVALAAGYALRKDPEGFELGVPEDWRRTPANTDRQVRYRGDGFTLLVVPGRDAVEDGGADPLAYQADKERELRPFRESTWSGSSGLRRIDVGRQSMAEGQFTWQDADGREVFARNLAVVVDGRYHVIQVIGPESRRDEVSDIYQQAVSSYRVTR